MEKESLPPSIIRPGDSRTTQKASEPAKPRLI